MDLENLMQSLKDGDIKALEMIYNKTKTAVYASVYGILRCDSSVEDIMQETYLKVYRNINNYKFQGYPKAWICKIAKNLALDTYRKNKRFVSLNDYENKLSYADDVDTKDTAKSIIKIAKEILKADNFQIVIMFTVGEMKHYEISKVLGIPYATVRWKYFSSINKIKKYITDNNIEL